MLHFLNQKVFERILFILLASFILEISWVSFSEILAKFGIGASIFGLIPSLLDDFVDQNLADDLT